MISVVNKATGEVVEADPKTLDELIEAYRTVSETIKAYDSIKKQLSSLSQDYINEKGVSEPVNGYMFRSSFIQRYNYDKSVLREVLDEDELDLLLEPSKSAVDKYLKDHLEDLGDASTRLRQSMLPVGAPYSVTKLEKIER